MSALERRAVARNVMEESTSIKPSSVLLNGNYHDITVIDLSANGAKIKGISLYTDQKVSLKLGDGSERKSEVVWSMGDISGLIFLD